MPLFLSSALSVIVFPSVFHIVYILTLVTYTHEDYSACFTHNININIILHRYCELISAPFVSVFRTVANTPLGLAILQRPIYTQRVCPSWDTRQYFTSSTKMAGSDCLCREYVFLCEHTHTRTHTQTLTHSVEQWRKFVGKQAQADQSNFHDMCAGSKNYTTYTNSKVVEW